MYKLKNLAKGTLNAQLLSGGTSLTLESGDGAKFPDTGSDNVFVGVLWSSSYASPEGDSNAEFVKAYRTSGDTFTLVRAQEGTSASQWEAGDNFALVASSAVLESLVPWASSQTVKTSNYTFTGAEGMNSCWQGNTGSGNLTFTVSPDLFDAGFELHFSKGTSDANTLTLDAGSSNNINGSQTIVISKQYHVLSLVKDGASTWRVKSSYINETQYPLLAGRDGGQTLVGGSGVTDILKLQGTSGNGTLTSPAVQVKVGNNGGTTALTVLNNGNVGIGTTSPLARLHLNGGTGSLSTGLAFGDGDTGLYEASDDVLRIATAGSTRVTVDASGNVGIGTTSPGAELEVNGFAQFGNSLDSLTLDASSGNPVVIASDSSARSRIFFSNTGTGDAQMSFADGSSTQWSAGWSRGTGNFVIADYFDLDTSPRLVIDNTGNVGIGTTSPTAKLEVKGAGTTSSTTNMLLTDSAGTALLTVRNDGAYAFKGGTLGLAQSGYSVSNVTTDRTYDANATTLDEIADVLGTLIGDLMTKGIISA